MTTPNSPSHSTFTTATPPKSKFREHLSIFIPPLNFPIETSRFSPESPPTPPQAPRTISTWTNSSTMRSPVLLSKERDIEAGPSTSPRSVSTGTTNIKDRFTKLWFDVRTLGRDKEPELVPIQPAVLPPWSPLHVGKRNTMACCTECPCRKKQQKRRRTKRNRILICVLVLIILYLLGNTIFLNVRVLNTSTPPSSIPHSAPNTLSIDTQQCLSQYNVNAPSDPLGYPCGSCLPVLQQVPPNFSDSNPQDSQQIQNAVQFCGLRSIFDTSNDEAQSTFRSGGWVGDVKFCTWTGVSCDGTGKVSSLVLTFPAVPAAIPNEIGALDGLQALRVIGDSTIPAGSLPNTFTSLTSLGTLHLESTAITTIPDIFNSLNKLVTLELVRNTAMGSQLPSSLRSISLQNLVVNGQALNNPLSDLSTSAPLQSSMKLIDLSSTSLSGIVPSTISAFTSLVELHLDDNNLAGPLPPNFPSTLASFSMSNNTGLGGSNTGSFCSLPKLQNCDMRNTGLAAPGGCGVCTF
ncbi:RNI-like protein [Cristinia sonorae]|uniref:RNI-like protein n=1 Tax=Cristinia sonorae TaxID=1940300 RepID=A0A8K0XS18_9AGAR|nr:RNI-like protein [Cristinia sonorae]